MDHIPMPADREPFSIVVPYLVDAAHQYDNGDFETFPSRCGFDPDLAKLAIGKTLDELLSFVQAWLFFGTLQAAFGTAFRQEDFVREDEVEGHAMLRIDTSQLGTYMVAEQSERAFQWRRLWQRPPHIRRSMSHVHSQQGWRKWQVETYFKIRRTEETRKTLEIAHKAYRYLLEAGIEDETEIWAVLILSVGLLLEYLEPLGEKALPMHIQNHHPPVGPIVRWLTSWPAWCIHDTEQIFARNSYTTALYLANLRRSSRPGIDHDICKESQRCIAYNIDNESFVCKHVEPGCECEHMVAPKAEMLRILQEGGIPVLRYEANKDGTHALSYVRASHGARYTAISHLWADGLGNPQDNTLPRCQIQRIAAKVAETNRLFANQPLNVPMKTLLIDFTWLFNAIEKLCSRFEEQTVDFWLDVYCVPIVPNRNSDSLAIHEPADVPLPYSRDQVQTLKEIALSRMFETYSWARCTLVLDEELSRASKDCAPSEYLARTALCAWNTRCWTFHEYCLAPSTVFQFDAPRRRPPYNADKKTWMESANIDTRLLEDFKALSRPEMTYLGGRQPEGFWFGAAGAFEPTARDDGAFRAIWNCLVQRNTTKWEDVSRITANLLYLNALELRDTSPRELMKAIVASQEFLPVAILHAKARRYGSFSEDDDRVQAEDSWVPVSPTFSEKFPASKQRLLVHSNGLSLVDTSSTTIENQIFELIEPKTNTWSFSAGDYTVWVRLRTSANITGLDRILLVLDWRFDILLKRPGGLSEYHQGFCLIPKGQPGEYAHNIYLCPVDWGVYGYLPGVEPQIPHACIAHPLQIQSGALNIDCDVASWRQGTRDRQSTFELRRNAARVISTIHYLLIVMVWFWPIFSLVKWGSASLHGASGVAAYVLTIVLVPIFELYVGLLSSACCLYIAVEVLYHIQMSAGISDIGHLLPWWRCVNLTLPRSRRGVSIFRYWVLRPILMAMIYPPRTWNRLTRRHQDDSDISLHEMS